MMNVQHSTAKHLAPRAVAILFTATIFLSASLLFFVQPLFTKIALPAIGGAAAVWTTAMLFFQTVLIAGYLYAHLMSKYTSVKVQMFTHLALWAIALMFLPLSLPSGWTYDAQGSTAIQTLTLYAFGVGMPFAVLSANAPLIQSWYSKSNGPSAHDPYFLYGASNLGSLIALLAFPLVAEPLFGAKSIGWAWAGGFVVLGAFLLAAASQARSDSRALPIVQENVDAGAKPGAATIVKWLFLAFIPSSLMLGVTTKVSTDLGSIPLFWVVPLALYLLTFVLSFTNRPLIATAKLRVLLMASIVVMAVLTTDLWAPSLSWGQTGLLVLAFLITSMMAHQRLYEARPHQSYLTLFYVIMSVGGALGGLFNSIFAPMVFNEFFELRITVALSALLIVAFGTRLRAFDALFGVVLGLIALMPLSIGFTYFEGTSPKILAAIIATLFAVILWKYNTRSYAVVTALFTLIVGASFASYEPSIFADRSFFGAHRVVDRDGLRLYANGTTMHGAERVADLTVPRPSGMAYYHSFGPMGQIMSSPRGQSAKSVGIVGLGVGALACYKAPGQSWHFYEIDQKVDEIARNPALFTFMSNCADDAPTHLGDARIVLDQQKDIRFDILVIDAYSSDTVPVHLTTTDALALYKSRLNPGGLLVFHISNRYYQIDLPLARSAASLGMTAMMQIHNDAKDLEKGLFPSTVVIMAQDPADLGDLAKDARWTPLISDGKPEWTDDYANLLSILK
jgi:hypothetical protein